MVLASQIYAQSQGIQCIGPDRCHWCGAPCERQPYFKHDDRPYLPFEKHLEPSKNPGGSYICQGCWFWRRPRQTVHFLSGGFKDTQAPKNHSWLITENGSWVISQKDWEALYGFLLKPTGSFALSIKAGDKSPENLLQCSIGNDLSVIDANTPISFTVNNSSHQYTIYELEEAIKAGKDGKDPGIGILFSLASPPKILVEKQEKRGRGHPSKEDRSEDGRIASRSIFRSGNSQCKEKI